MIQLWKPPLLISYLLVIHGSAYNIEAETGNLPILSTETISACPWSINITFECTVHGGENDSTSTVWRGSAFSGHDCNNDEIILIHNRFVDEPDALGMCNDGDISGRIVNVTMGDDSIYISHLVVIVRSGMIGKDIECYHDDGANESLVGSTSLNVSTSIICMHTSTPYLSTSVYIDMGTIEGVSNILVTSGVFVLLFLLILAAIPLLLLFKFRKTTRNTGPKASLPEESIHHPATNHNEVKSYIDVTLKAFDNENMGIYNLGDDSLDDVTVLKTDSSRKDETLVCDLNSLVHALRGPFSSKWYSFGLAIGLPKDILNHIKHHSDSDEECLIEVLDYWLRNHSSKPTWEEVTEAKRKVNSNSIF